jgi:hypothetical protein
VKSALPILRTELLVPKLPPEIVKEKPIPTWRIYSKWADQASFLGVVSARTEHLAIQQAIEQFQIANQEHQKRLVAEKRRDDD